jgi:hypothetical protein
VPDVQAAIDRGWVPSYWNDDVEVPDPVCALCAEAKLQFNEEYGDYELKGVCDVPFVVEA